MHRFIVFGGLGLLLLILVLRNFISLESSITVSVLAITAIFIAIQAKATRDLLENDKRPAVEVGVLCNEKFETSFQFLQLKSVPALVYVKFSAEVKIDGKWEKIDLELLPKLKGEKPWIVVHPQYQTMYYNFTSSIAKTYFTKEVRAILDISLASIFDKNNELPFYTKTYEMKWESNEWVDSCWHRSEPDLIKQN
ncbi:MAG: hypothetical protein HYX21_03150 [Candidatus Yanofskybacteria bacterium]|nr:hypothetical protein [Candidatus Yanofskybacteria bacterium]